ncbi:flavodoxin family protein [Listeria seeligeri]|uniref:flavodoxin family protein n=1 Tax=Listeria seeligeri TaxID=1640 RepID=UPI001627CB0B|nr:NAD(P)H-dependent oxidoreductase [Listeria seeligeri]MBC1422656.1 NAD(P)H-dependent oxidoreductase [Listeria seeligeri]MBC1471977.1 NAD(P)H-dependent oxidoreductase [Listeria seeligeri]MBC1480361.1 NAD(P)H-dependent oxidoreductase [Listeria seeligeri]MBC1528683.1 NAD(P)H-dependent oxidoreductase [Listeria seeligeri]MBC1752311.1 NAD(P)H-dependent oxidoreductase [Listeria seeligeri]
MKKLAFVLALPVIVVIFLAIYFAGNSSTKGENVKMSNRNLFINASQNRNGNTAKLAKDYFGNQKYKQINLIDYDIKQLGQVKGTDDFEKVRSEIEEAENIVIGTPVYWSDMTGLLKTFIDRHELVDERYNDKNIKIIVQGSGPTDKEIKAISHIIEHFSERFGMEYRGVIK